MTWTAQLADARTGTPLAELRDATARTLKLRWKQTPTFEFTVRTDHPLHAAVRQLERTLVKVYDDSTGNRTLRKIGPIVAYDKTRSDQGGAIKVSSAGAGWRLGKRLIGKNPAGATFGSGPTTPVDRGEMAGRLLDALNAGEASSVFADAADTGIRRGTLAATTTSFAGPWRYKPALQSLVDLAAGLDGFEWEIAPIEPTADALGLKIGELNIAPVIGVQRPNAVFEFGAGRANVAEWHEIGSADALCNRATNLPSGWPDNVLGTVVAREDAASIAARGLYEDMISTDLSPDDLRSKLVQLHVDLRKQPRLTITFKPVAEDQGLPASERRVPRLFVDYQVGDLIPFRATERFPVIATDGSVLSYRDVLTVNATFRVFGADVTLDDHGVPLVTPILVEESA